MSECGICAGCIGMGPCDDELGVRGNECGECALEADHFGPCWWPGMPGEGHDDECESEMAYPGVWTLCRCDERQASDVNYHEGGTDDTA